VRGITSTLAVLKVLPPLSHTTKDGSTQCHVARHPRDLPTSKPTRPKSGARPMTLIVHMQRVRNWKSYFMYMGGLLTVGTDPMGNEEPWQVMAIGGLLNYW